MAGAPFGELVVEFLVWLIRAEKPPCALNVNSQKLFKKFPQALSFVPLRRRPWPLARARTAPLHRALTLSQQNRSGSGGMDATAHQ